MLNIIQVMTLSGLSNLENPGTTVVPNSTSFVLAPLNWHQTLIKRLKIIYCSCRRQFGSPKMINVF